MKRLIYQVSVGKPSKLYEGCMASVKAYAEAIGADYVRQTVPKLMITPDPFMTGRSKEATARLGYLPIFEKENAFDLLHEYDQAAIIDADIWVRPGSPDIFEGFEYLSFHFAGVAEREMPVTPAYARKINNYSRMQYGNLKSEFPDFDPQLGCEFFNMGLMVLNKSILEFLRGQTAKEFLRRPEFKGFVDGVGNWKWSTDQTLLNWWIKKEKMEIFHLDWKWNALYTAIPDSMTKQAHFVHFFLKDKLPEKGENFDALMEIVN